MKNKTYKKVAIIAILAVTVSFGSVQRFAVSYSYAQDVSSADAGTVVQPAPDATVAPTDTSSDTTVAPPSDAPTDNTIVASTDTTSDTTTQSTDLSAPSTDTTVTNDTSSSAPADTTVTDNSNSAPSADVSVSNDTTTAPMPVLTSDQLDYNPGQTATIFGKFFQSLQNIVLKIFGGSTADNTYTESTQNITTDNSGTFTTTYQLDNVYRPLYTVTANSTIDGTQLAQMTFTDANLASDFLQCANKNPTLGQCDWISSILQTSDARYFEGMSTLQRLTFNNIPTTAGNVHTLSFHVDAQKANIHAYDFLTSWDAAVAAAGQIDPSETLMPAGLLQANRATSTANATAACDNPSNPQASLQTICRTLRLASNANVVTVVMPNNIGDPNVGGPVNTVITNYQAHFVDTTGMRLYGAPGSPITAALLTFGGYSAPASDQQAFYTLHWTSSSTQLEVEFATHIAEGTDPLSAGLGYGAGLGAASISGGPYHVSLDLLDGGSIGNQDNQLKGADILLPASVPAVTTQVQNASNVDITNTTTTAGTVVHDHATVDTGSASVLIPAGSTFTFHKYTNGSCTGTPTDQTGVAVSSGAQTGSANSPTFTPTTGSYSYLVDFVSGNSTTVKNATGVCEPFSVAKINSNTATVIHNVAHATVTSVSAGATVHDQATVSGAGPTPTGSLTFNWFTNNSCSIPAAATSSALSLLNGVVDATGFAQGPLNAGDYSFQAVYSGDGTYNGSTGACEPLSVTKVSPSISTTPNPSSGTVGVTLNDSATLSGGFNPAGNVAFKLFPPSDAICALSPAFSATDGTATYTADPGFASNAVGTWHWTADYAGDTNNNATSSGCVAEPVTIGKANSTTTTAIHNDSNHSTDVQNTTIALGSTIHDQVTVSGLVGTPTGTTTIQYWTNGTCASTPASTSGATALVSGVVDATGFAKGPLSAGSYSFKATYNGDANYNSSVGSCESVTVGKATTVTQTKVHNTSHQDITNSSVAPGSIVHDAAFVDTQVGNIVITGNVTYNFFNNGSCASTTAGSETVAVGTESSATGALAAGAYSYKADYSGDNNYSSSTGVCESFKVVDAKISISASSTNEVGHDHTFTVTVQKNLGDGAGLVAASGVSVTSSISGTGSISGGTCVSGTTDVSGQCTIIVSSAGAGVGTVHASTTFTIDGVSVTRATGDGLSGDSSDTTKTWVDASISLTPLSATNKVGDAHTITAHVTKNDGSGASDASGVLVTFSVASGSATFVSNVNTCTTNASGVCSIQIISSTTGSNTVHATITFSVGGVSLTRASGDGLSSDSADASKAYVNARISINPATSTNEVGSPHTFTVTVESDNGSGFSPVLGAIVNATSSPTPNGGLDVSNCNAGTNASGQCTVVVNSSVAGVFTIAARSMINVGGVDFKLQTNGVGGNSIPAVKTYVDAKISIGQSGTNEVGSPHTFTGHVDVNPGNGFVNAPDNTTISFGISGVGGLSASSCLTIGDTGSCSVTDTSSVAGTDTVNASTTLTVGGLSLSRGTTGTAGNSGPATKKWVDANITITPANATNSIQSAHVFTVTITQVPGSEVPATTTDVSTNVSPTPDVTNTTTCGSGVAFSGNVATCTITINNSAPGTFTANATATISIGGVTLIRATGDSKAGDSAAATKTYVAGALEITKVIAGLDNVVGSTTISKDFTVTVTGPSYLSGHDIVFHLVNGVLQAPATVSLSPLIPGSYTVGEADAGTQWSEAVATSPVSVAASATSSVTVTNTFVPGSLQVTKALVLGGYTLPVNASFTIVVTGPSYPSSTNLAFSVVNGVVSGAQTLSNLIPGSYNVNEPNPGAAWTASGSGNVTVNPSGTGSKTITNTLKQPHTTILISSNVQETTPSENVILTITDTNDGFVPLSSPSVTLTYGTTTVTLDKTHFYVSGDTGNDGIMGVGEVWTWSYTAVIGVNTTFNVAGHGIDLLGNDISPTNGYTTEGGSVNVSVIGTTRTLGFWQTHTTFTSSVFSTFFAGGMPIGTVPHKGVITNIQSAGQSQLFGGFYAPIPKMTTGAQRNAVDKARMQLLQQLLAAKLNCAAFGCGATTQGQITNADSVYATGTAAQILAAASQLDAFNNSGDAFAIPASLGATGKATPKVSTSYADLAFWNLP